MFKKDRFKGCEKIMQKREVTKEELEQVLGVGILVSAFAVGSIIGAFVYSFFKKV